MEPEKIMLDEGEIMTCTINPHRSFPNDAMSCIFTGFSIISSDKSTRPELYVRKNQSVIIEDSGDLEINILEYAREKTISRFSIKRSDLLIK